MGVLTLLGSTLGWLIWILPSRMRSVTEENINRCFPERTKRERNLLIKENLVSNCLTLLESTQAWTQPPHAIRNRILRVGGKHEIDKLYAKGNGVLIIIPHLGNWEILNHYLGNAYGLTHMYQPNKNLAMEHIVQDGRMRSGAKFVEANQKGIKRQIETLRKGGVIGLMPDQEPANHSGSFSPFFGIDALTSELPIRYLEKTNASPVLAYCTRSKDRKGFNITLEALESDLTLEKMNLTIEGAIKKYPQQYLWSYKRFRTRPDAEPDFYDTQPSRFIEPAKQTVLSALGMLTTQLSFRLINKISNHFFFPSAILYRHRKIARINLSLCSQDSKLLNPSMIEFTKLAFETGKIWYSAKSTFDTYYRYNQIELSGHGAIVLTPPLGNREIVMRHLGQYYETTDYYHPAKKQSVDLLVRKARRNMTIKLVDHNKKGQLTLLKELAKNKVVTLCPDQQPRLRGGEFIPFFSCPALTTRTLSQIIIESRANLFFGVAIRSDNKFELKFIPLIYDQEQEDIPLLTFINQALEKLIEENPSQYRWSDKRFNIRPSSMTKVYA